MPHVKCSSGTRTCRTEETWRASAGPWALESDAASNNADLRSLRRVHVRSGQRQRVRQVRLKGTGGGGGGGRVG